MGEQTKLPFNEMREQVFPVSDIAGVRKYSRRGYLLEHTRFGFPSPSTAYRKNRDGSMVQYDGSPIPQRNDPRRVAQEFALLQRYILGTTKTAEEYALTQALSQTDPDTELAHSPLPKWATIRYAYVQPMHPDCRVSVMIPARFEAERILETLNGFAHQHGTLVNPDSYELNVLNSVRRGEEPDDTLNVIYNFAVEHPELRLNFWHLEIDERYDTVGRKRKMLADAVIDRATSNREYHQSLFLIPTDADEIDVDPFWIQKTIDNFDANPHLDILTGHHERLDPLLFDNDLIVMYYRGLQTIQMLARAKALKDPARKGYNWVWNREVSGNGPVSITAEALAMIGGYDPNLMTGEDMIVGEMVGIARGTPQTIDGRKVLVSNLDTVKLIGLNGSSNFIRQGTYLITSTPPYNNEEFVLPKEIPHEEILEHLSLFRRINPNKSANIRRFASLVKDQMRALKKIVGNQRLFETVYAPQLLNVLGFRQGDYDDPRGGRIQIRSWEGVIQKLAEERSKPFDPAKNIAFGNRRYGNYERELGDSDE